MQPALQRSGAVQQHIPLRRTWSSSGIESGQAPFHLTLSGTGSPDPQHRSASCLGTDQARYRGRPFREPVRAAGQPSGGPVKRDYLTKFVDREGRQRDDPRGLPAYALSRANWQTMKYDMNWNAYNDVARPHAASDLTGFAKLYLG
eukprot:TRINITY_DN90930_c0_g1_i1.p2 TRINITY_DN90930_c0_g1~~TRINITY_DN90930_c0_g1_i1.p2  ORF type:complete len:168 (+),score=10.15 TRINITY_DN90930_c0_g1_i1:67-504(+)